METKEEIVERYKREIKEINLPEISSNLQIEFMLFDDSGFDRTEIIKKIDRTNDITLNAIFKYGEMIKLQTEINYLYLEYRRNFNKNKSLKRFEVVRRTIGTGMRYVMVRISQLIQVYKFFIEFALNVVKKLKDIIVDPNILWGSVSMDNRIELIQKFNDRLIPCMDLIEECNTLQPTSLNILTEMERIFNELKGLNTFENFMIEMNELLNRQGSEVRADDYKRKIDILSNKILKAQKKDLIIHSKMQKFNEINDMNSFEVALNRWKNEKNSVESTHQNKKRKFIDIPVSTIITWFIYFSTVNLLC